MAKQLRFSSLGEALGELATLEKAAAPKPTGEWTLAQILNHCAASIEYSITGYPKNRPAFVRWLVGRLVINRFLRRGAMSHNRAAEIPGAVTTPSPGDAAAGLSRLRAAIDAFQASQGPLAEHFLYGKVTRAEYDQVHAMHIADHLSGVDY